MAEYRTKRVPEWIIWYGSASTFPTKYIDFADRDGYLLYGTINLNFRSNIRFHTLLLPRRRQILDFTNDISEHERRKTIGTTRTALLSTERFSIYTYGAEVLAVKDTFFNRTKTIFKKNTISFTAVRLSVTVFLIKATYRSTINGFGAKVFANYQSLGLLSH
jgi:hypothetical protein